MRDIPRDLSSSITGCVFDSHNVCNSYSTDCSELKITPSLVVFPRSVADIQEIIRIVAHAKTDNTPLSITMRGSGTSDTGASLSTNIIVSTEHFNSLLDINPRERLVRVQPGITLGELNKILSTHGLYIPVYGHDDATIGGLISTNPTDNYAATYHGISHYVKGFNFVTPTGEVVHLQPYHPVTATRKAKSHSTEGNIYQEIKNLLASQAVTINKISKNSPNLAGYPGIAKVTADHKFSLLPLFFGSEGTLGIISEVILRAIPLPNKINRAIITLPHLHLAQDFLNRLASLKPRRLEIYDLDIFRSFPHAVQSLKFLFETPRQTYAIYVEFDHHIKASANQLAELSHTLPFFSTFLSESPSTKPLFDQFASHTSSLLSPNLSYNPFSFFRNIYIPKWNLSSFINDLDYIKTALNIPLLLFGSFSTNIYHLLPIISPEDTLNDKKLKKLSKAFSICVRRQGGTLAGGAPEGRTKVPFTTTSLDDDELLIYRTIKSIFDPMNVFNPGVKFDADELFLSSHIKNPSFAYIHAPTITRPPISNSIPLVNQLFTKLN